MKSQYGYLSPVKVYCSECKEWIDELKVKFLNISEDMLGRDRLEFECPTCKTKQESYRVG